MPRKRKEKSLSEVNSQLARIRRLNRELVLTGSHRDPAKPDYDLDNVAQSQADKAEEIGAKYKANLRKAIEKDTQPMGQIFKKYSYSTRAGITG